MCIRDRLDATNIIMPKLAINTNIGLDHVDYLGHDYQSIALNKAGIVKEGIDYLTGETKEECLAVFRDVCLKHHSELITLKPITKIIDGNNVSYHYRDYEDVYKRQTLSSLVPTKNVVFPFFKNPPVVDNLVTKYPPSVRAP